MNTDKIMSLEEQIPLIKSDIETLLDEKNTRLYSLWREHRNASLSGRASIWLMEFESSLRTAFGEEYHEIGDRIKGRIPGLIYQIKEEDKENAKERIAFLVCLYGRINHILRHDEWD